jgi:hypothetical protein
MIFKSTEAFIAWANHTDRSPFKGLHTALKEAQAARDLEHVARRIATQRFAKPRRAPITITIK